MKNRVLPFALSISVLAIALWAWASSGVAPPLGPDDDEDRPPRRAEASGLDADARWAVPERLEDGLGSPERASGPERPGSPVARIAPDGLTRKDPDEPGETAGPGAAVDGAEAPEGAAALRGPGEPAARGPHLELLESILDSNDVEALRRFLVTMTPNVLGEAEAKLLIERLGATGDRGLIAGILGHVGRIGGTAVTEALAQAVGEGTPPRVAGAILQTLGRINTEDAIRAVVATLDDPDRKRHHTAAFQALAAAKNPIAIAPISERLNDPDGRVRREAAQALAAIGTNEGWEGLLHYAGRGPVQDRGRGRALVERSMSAPEAIPILADALAREPDPHLRASVARAIAARRHPLAYAPLVQAARADRDATVRVAAILQLQRLGDRRAIAELTAIAQTDENRRVQIFAARAASTLDRR